MPAVMLLQKVYGFLSPKTFEPLFRSLCRGLRVRLEVVGKTDRGWIKIEVSGEDESAALICLTGKWGWSFLPDATFKSSSPRKIRGLVGSFM